jgi:hypothetical protein
MVLAGDGDAECSPGSPLKRGASDDEEQLEEYRTKARAAHTDAPPASEEPPAKGATHPAEFLANMYESLHHAVRSPGTADILDYHCGAGLAGIGLVLLLASKGTPARSLTLVDDDEHLELARATLQANPTMATMTTKVTLLTKAEWAAGGGDKVNIVLLTDACMHIPEQASEHLAAVTDRVRPAGAVYVAVGAATARRERFRIAHVPRSGPPREVSPFEAFFVRARPDYDYICVDPDKVWRLERRTGGFLLRNGIF